LLRTGINGLEKRPTAFYPKMNIRVTPQKKWEMTKSKIRSIHRKGCPNEWTAPLSIKNV
jgi:hypothetical protein